MATARPRPQVMRLSEAAASRIKELMVKAERPIAGVKVGVKNGGCAGMEYTMEYVESFGPIAVRRMFSGAGVFADGLMIALVIDGVIYLKADESFVPLFEREGLAPFSYKTRDGKRTLNSYWRMPERLYDEPDELAEWAR